MKQDLLIVTDEGDFLRKQALRMIYALQNVFPEYTAEVRRFSDHKDIPELINFSSKKLVFLTWGYDFHQKVYTTKFLKSSTIQSNNDRFMLTLAKDLDGKPIDIIDAHFDEFNDKNRMTVNNMRLIDTWWPQIVAFLFDIPASHTCKRKWEYYTRTISGPKPVQCVDVVNACMEYFNVKTSSRPVPEYRGCNIVLCSGNFPEEVTENTVYISDSYMATETKPFQYNKEHWLAGLLCIFSKTGVIQKPLNEAVKDYTRRALDTCACGIANCTRTCWTKCKSGMADCTSACWAKCKSGMANCTSACWVKCKSGVKFLSGYFWLQWVLVSLAGILCVFGTGLPYWRGLIQDNYAYLFSYSYKNILYGLFKICTSERHNSYFSASADDCTNYENELPGWWKFQIVLCFLAIVLYLVAFALFGVHRYYRYKEHSNYTDAATVCNLTAGCVCFVIVIIWWQLSEDFICSIENCDNFQTNELHASFWIFVAITISYGLWIPCACLYHYCYN